MPNTGPYCVYVLECRDGSYYCGITTDMQKRLRQHNAGTASRYTRVRTPVKIIACTPHCYSRSAASKLEHRIKKAPRHKKPALLTMHARQAEKD